jgi:hypothetical protein
MARGEPATRMVVILGAVAAVALISAALLQSRTLARFFNRRLRPGTSRWMK